MKTWIAALALLSAATAFATEMKCGGTEPFWAVTVKNGKMTFSSPESPQDAVSAVVSTREAAGMIAGTATVVKTKNSTLTVVRGADCSDGMSEETYTHHAIYDADGTVFSGCCKVQ